MGLGRAWRRAQASNLGIFCSGPAWRLPAGVRSASNTTSRGRVGNLLDVAIPSGLASAPAAAAEQNQGHRRRPLDPARAAREHGINRKICFAARVVACITVIATRGAGHGKLSMAARGSALRVPAASAACAADIAL